jgi:spore germination cell wall hydrolase CwlJ-like protein
LYRSGDIALWAARFEGRYPPVGISGGRWLLGVGLAWTALLLIVQPATTRSREGRAPASVGRSTKPPASPPLPLALVEPTEPMALTPEEAQAFNATVPFIDGPISAARKFIFAGSHDDRERALTCLASAALYEAGDDKIGEQAVAQVVLNRIRHPAFPRTICGVVFQGGGRRTGCQFTFTCDGALRRVPSPEAWQRAREIADHALSGFVFKKVGTATHYHTDWVVPYWSDTLDKLTEVHSHLFYRWRGAWGRAAAFSQRPGGVEPLDPRIGYLAFPGSLAPSVPSPAHPALVITPAPHGRQQLIATIAPPAPASPSTVLPMSPETTRRVLPAPGAGRADSPASDRPAAHPQVISHQQVTMSFNRTSDMPAPAKLSPQRSVIGEISR